MMFGQNCRGLIYTCFTLFTLPEACAYYLKWGPLLGGTRCVLRAVV